MKLVGHHSSNDIHNSYGYGHSFEVLQEHIDKLSFPVIETNWRPSGLVPSAFLKKESTMINNNEKRAYLLVGYLAILSNVVTTVVSPFYETGASIYATPLIGISFIILFIFYIRMNFIAYQLSLYYSS